MTNAPQALAQFDKTYVIQRSGPERVRFFAFQVRFLAEMCGILAAMAKTLKNITPIYESSTGVCLWRMPDGAILGDDDNNYLCMDGPMNDMIVEGKVKKAAIYYIGSEAELGEPLWINGSRRCSEDEYQMQVERMEGGEIPDVVDELKQAGVKEFQ